MRGTGMLFGRVLLGGACISMLVGCAAGESFKQILPGIHLDQRSKTIAVDGAICLRKGILEYVAVAEGGKEYESALRLYCRPAHLQQAMLMAGYEVSEVPRAAWGDYGADADGERSTDAPAAAEPPASYWEKRAGKPEYVCMSVEVTGADGVVTRVPVEDLLIDRRTGESPEPLRWVFTGSYFDEGGRDRPAVFAADESRSVIALWYDPSCVLNLAEDVGNPYRGEDIGIEAGEGSVPALNTPVRLIIRPTD